jgi:hypothetical protein
MCVHGNKSKYYKGHAVKNESHPHSYSHSCPKFQMYVNRQRASPLLRQ